MNEKYMVGRIKSYKGIILGWSLKALYDTKELAIAACEPGNMRDGGWSHEYDAVIKVELTWECFAEFLKNTIFNDITMKYEYTTWGKYAEHS